MLPGNVVEGRAPARVGLVGNPSDLYEGAVLGFALEDFGARVRLTVRDDVGVGPVCLGADGRPGGPGSELLEAACARFRRLVPTELPGLELAFATDVPRQVGLAGSSALVVATLRALGRLTGRSLAPLNLALAALAAEVEDLGIVAGPQDRVLQAHGGLCFLDCAPPLRAASVERLDPALLPPLLVAWDPSPGEPSGVAHADVYQRWRAGDSGVRAEVRGFAELAREARQALLDGDRAVLGRCLDRNFDLRHRVFGLGAAARAPVELARGLGAAAKFCGSGGAVVVLPREDGDLPRLEAAFDAHGWRSLRPRVAPPCPEDG